MSAAAAAGVGSTGSVRRWVLGARPRTLPAALVPVLVGTGAAWGFRHGAASALSPALASGSQPVGPRVDPWWCALGALVVALCIQVGTNYANDYSDGVRGTDDRRVGPLRLVGSGLVDPSSVKRAAVAAFAVASAVGLFLAWATSWWVLVVGAGSIVAGWLYTGGPRPYGYAGLGELFVFVFFGLVATLGTFYVQTLRLGAVPVWVAAGMVGLLATALLLANNLRDVASDAASGKRTLVVRTGRRAGGWLYAACVCLPFAAALVWLAVALAAPLSANVDPAIALPLAAFPLAVPLVSTVLGPAEGTGLLPVLAGTGRLQLAFGALLAAALLWWFW